MSDGHDHPTPKWGYLEIRTPLSRGCFGERFLAFDPVLCREVVLELGPAGRGTDTGWVERVRAFAGLRHPDIVAVHGIETHEERVGAWFEFVPGPTLAESIAHDGPLEDSMLGSVGVDLCRILHEIHAADLAHGALCPASVARSSDGRIVLIDIGPARVDGPISPGPQLRELQRRDLRDLAVLLTEVANGAPTNPDLASVLTRAEDLTHPALTAITLACRIAAVLDRALPEDLLAVRELPASFPKARTSFLGRERERAVLRRRLLSDRLCTIRGPGGCGKTRLALEVGQEMSAAFSGLIAWVDLAFVQNAEAIGAEVLQSAGLRASPPRAEEEVLAERIGRADALLILDNCEHLQAECARIATFLLARCPGLRILATSRQRLDIDGEWVLSLSSLGLPREGAPEPELRKSAALQLFLARARSAHPELSLRAEGVTASARICRLVDGIPLAIELAAAWARTLSLSQIADRLQDSLDLLRVSGNRAGRAATIRASIEWSYRLLDPEERTLFRRLGILSSPWSEEAASAIAADSDRQAQIGDRSIATLLAGLVEKSLIERFETARGSRYRHLDLILRFAHATLTETGELTTQERRHYDYYAWLTEHHGADIYLSDVDAHLEAMREAMPNVLAAQRYSITPAVDSWSAYKTAVYSSRALGLLGRYAEDSQITAAVLGKDEVPSNARAALLVSHAESAVVMSRLQVAERAAMDALAIFRELAIPMGIAMATISVAEVALARGDLERARGLVIEGLELRRKAEDHVGAAGALNFLGVIAARAERYDEAADWYGQALALAETSGNTHMVLRAHANLAAAYRDLGDLPRAHETATQLLEALQGSAIGDEVAGAHRLLGGILRRLADLDGARGHLIVALELHALEGQRRMIFETLLELALLDHASGHSGEAAQSLGAAESLEDSSEESIGHSIPWLRKDLDTLATSLRRELGDARWAMERSVGRERGFEWILTRLRERAGPGT